MVGTRLSTGWPWETLRYPSPNRDFAYVARDKLTQMLKCHVFRCEAPAKNIATSLHEICSKIMAERRNARCLVNGLSLDHSKLVDVPFQGQCHNLTRSGLAFVAKVG